MSLEHLLLIGTISGAIMAVWTLLARIKKTLIEKELQDKKIIEEQKSIKEELKETRIKLKEIEKNFFDDKDELRQIRVNIEKLNEKVANVEKQTRKMEKDIYEDIGDIKKDIHFLIENLVKGGGK